MGLRAAVRRGRERRAPALHAVATHTGHLGPGLPCAEPLRCSVGVLGDQDSYHPCSTSTRPPCVALFLPYLFLERTPGAVHRPPVCSPGSPIKLPRFGRGPSSAVKRPVVALGEWYKMCCQASGTLKHHVHQAGDGCTSKRATSQHGTQLVSTSSAGLRAQDNTPKVPAPAPTSACLARQKASHRFTAKVGVVVQPRMS